MSDAERSQQFYVMQHAEAQKTIARLRGDYARLHGFVERVAWGEWMEHPDGGGLFGDVIPRGFAAKVRDEARALVRSGQEEAA